MSQPSRLFQFIWLGLLLGLGACAATPEKRAAAPVNSGAAFAEAATAPLRKIAIDSDGDQILDPNDPCPLEPGEREGDGCPAQYGYFFVRIVNDERLPVPASLVFQPVVNRIVVQEDGYAGMLRPGVYHLRAQAPGYDPAEMMFEVQANQKALIEIHLQTLQGK